MSALETWERCGQVEPFWVRLGSIQWQGVPTPEPHYMIEYRRCSRLPVRPSTLCLEHLASTPGKGTVE